MVCLATRVMSKQCNIFTCQPLQACLSNNNLLFLSAYPFQGFGPICERHLIQLCQLNGVFSHLYSTHYFFSLSRWANSQYKPVSHCYYLGTGSKLCVKPIGFFRSSLVGWNSQNKEACVNVWLQTPSRELHCSLCDRPPNHTTNVFICSIPQQFWMSKELQPQTDQSNFHTKRITTNTLMNTFHTRQTNILRLHVIDLSVCTSPPSAPTVS